MGDRNRLARELRKTNIDLGESSLVVRDAAGASLLDTADLTPDPGVLAAGAEVARVYRRVFTLTDAQVKSFPTDVRHQLLAAPGAGKRYVFIQAEVETDLTADYDIEDILDGDRLTVSIGSVGDDYIVSDASRQRDADSISALADLLTGGGGSATLLPSRSVAAGFTYPATVPVAALENQPMWLRLNASQNYGGGHASNSFTVTVYFAVVGAA
jgi:hypothetical protein